MARIPGKILNLACPRFVPMAGRKLQRMGTWHGPVGVNTVQSRSAPDGFQPVPLVKVESEPSLGMRACYHRAGPESHVS